MEHTTNKFRNNTTKQLKKKIKKNVKMHDEKVTKYVDHILIKT